MAKTISLSLDTKSIGDAIKAVKTYQAEIKRKEAEFVRRLAEAGAVVASLRFSRAIYNGTNDVSVRVEENGRTATIYAEGEAVGFIEFGSGAKYGGGHPLNAEFGTGPGTWSDGPNGKGHWNNPKGWWFGSSQHSYGNPPAMAMFEALRQMSEQYTDIAKEVFGS